VTTITWNLQVERGARAVNWSAKSIFPAFERITRYWNVNFVQVASVNCRMPIVLTTRTWGKAAMWTAGNRIYVPASFRWASYDLSVAALVHEIGHVFGGSNHAMAGNLMAANLSDPYLNFTITDAFWFRAFAWRGNLRPWSEPNRWRPLKSNVTPDEHGEVSCKHSHPLWQGISDWFRPRVVEDIAIE
jgi:hypothetical protein